MKINIGAGESKIEGYVTCDYDPASNPDYLINLETDTFPFEDNSVEAVIAHHIFEHLGEGYFHCLKELYRVCKHGAIIDVRAPHHRNDCFFDDPTHKRPITIGGLLLFSKKHNRLCRELNSASSLLAEYFNVDFEVVSFDYTPAKQYQNQFNGEPRDIVEKYLREHSNIIEEIHVKLVVVKNESRKD